MKNHTATKTRRELSHLLGSYVTYALLTKLVWSRWQDIGQGFFFAFLWTERNLRSIKTQKKKKNEANIQPS